MNNVDENKKENLGMWKIFLIIIVSFFLGAIVSYVFLKFGINLIDHVESSKTSGTLMSILPM